ncbi:type 2 lanthipeptide synthetase LanM family protein [Azospirillum thermophilum]|uniref:Lantibiotic biosynthesis protein dehydration domain-containing protein n=1 Tax=Azospirillum thermophilum TaxID=2202148 RepID=A0A2S2CV47_9PROT|nr:type 2 lanthipeptide synthetase LanM family protein [Azospirillum thermophilum]AWK88157.1 hypothetical protein DEW08_18715 [Azospirillum thermophilum]
MPTAVPTAPPDPTAGVPSGDDRTVFDADDLFRRAEGLRAAAAGERLRDPAAAGRYARWLRYAAGGDRQAMRRHLRAEGLWPAAVRPLRSPGVPDWADTLAALMEAARGAGTQGPPPADPRTLPFADLLAPAARLARALLCRRLAERGVPAAWTGDALLDGLERAILRRLSQVAAPTLHAAFRHGHPPDLLAVLLGRSPAGEKAPDAAYRTFVAGTLADGYAGLFMRYPVLARSLCLLVGQGAGAAAELLERLAADAEAVAAGAPPVAVEAGLSDPHAGGRTVARLRLADGRSVAYKPRDLSMEAAFSDLLRWVNGQGLRHAHRVPAVLERDGYGWMEWVEPAPCRDAAELEAYWWRAGSLMALYTALDGNDLHHENLVAAGACPVLIDVECLLHPHPSTIAGQPEIDAPRLPGLPTSGFLPLYGFSGDGRPVNFAAFGPPAGPLGIGEPGFANAGTDWMTAVELTAPFPAGHVPVLDGVPRGPADHVEAIVAGFTDTRRLLMERADWLLSAPDSPLARLGGALGRYMMRPTPSYGLLLTKAGSPDAMADGIGFDLLLEALHGQGARLPPALRALVPVERAALRRLDVPRFSVRPGDLRVHDAEGRPLHALWREPPLAGTARRLRSYDGQALALDSALIRQALGGLPPLALPRATRPAGPDIRRDVLRAVADTIAGRALEFPNGGLRWLGLTSDATSGLVVAQPSGPGLYGGAAGIALFLAAAGRLLDDPALRDLSRRTLEPLAAPFDGAGAEDLARGLGPGYGGGIGGLIAVLGWCGDLLDAPHLTAAAGRIADLSAAAIGAGHPHDLIGGEAGLALALLTLHARKPGSRLLAAAAAAGHAALRAAVRDGDALRWPMSGAPGLTGLSHGAAGFALAFAHLYRATGDRLWRDAMAGALAYERRCFLPEHGNWPDLRDGAAAPGGAPRLVASWCHGAPGIALSRLGILQALGGEEEAPGTAADLETALATTRRYALQTTDDLCCGNGGRLAILHGAGHALGRAELLAEAEAGLHARLAHACAAGCCRLWHDEGALLGGDPHLFKGLAGFGYGIARTLDPTLIPDVLLPAPSPAF